MQGVDVWIVNAFVRPGCSVGNPAGIVFVESAAALGEQDMRLIASKSPDCPETVFVKSGELDDDFHFHARFFTPELAADEVGFCGHATMALFGLMLQKGQVVHGKTYKYKTQKGLCTVEIEQCGSECSLVTWVELVPNVDYRPAATLPVLADVAKALQVDPNVVETDIEAIDMGCMDLHVGLKAMSAAKTPTSGLERDTPISEFLINQLSAAAIEREVKRLTEKHDLTSFHLHTVVSGKGTEASPLIVETRDFAPICAIQEEAATGSASAALAVKLSKKLWSQSSCTSEQTFHFVFEQGRTMGSLTKALARVTLCQKPGNEVQVQRVVIGGGASIPADRQPNPRRIIIGNSHL
eukprot:TRINITY_DN74050_c0_g1_i1.p1 TRINITY_DN74050_c0_g1~~TRINITY_DN74050_c0_g1_i1.p1  ORF type:complete len:353 (+),score=38.25 TRINITY_DN74050_c0_g1_i1:76-1134(+)